MIRPVTLTSICTLTLALVLGACAGDPGDPVAADAPGPLAQTATDEPAPAQTMADDMASEQTHTDEQPNAAPAAPADRTVEVDMRDIAFSISELEVTVGETIRFLFTNAGEARHEAVVGDEHVQAEHAAQMSEGMTHEGMSEGHHGDAPAISLAPGESGELIVTFEAPGEVLIGCHEPGHYDAGMVMTVTVTP